MQDISPVSPGGACRFVVQLNEWGTKVNETKDDSSILQEEGKEGKKKKKKKKDKGEKKEKKDKKGKKGKKGDDDVSCKNCQTDIPLFEDSKTGRFSSNTHAEQTPAVHIFLSFVNAHRKRKKVGKCPGLLSFQQSTKAQKRTKVSERTNSFC